MSHRSRLCHFVIDVDDLDQALVFWKSALDATEEPVNPASRHVYRRLELPDSDIRILLQQTDDPKAGKERMHLDLETGDVETEVRRLEQLGATRHDHQQLRGFDFWVLRDPWHNEFCVLQTTFADLLDQRPPWPSRTDRPSALSITALISQGPAQAPAMRRVSSLRCGPRRRLACIGRFLR